MLPWENKEDNRTSSGTTGNKTFTAAETSSNNIKDSLTEEQERAGGETVDSGSVGGVNTERSVVVLIGNHFGLKKNNEIRERNTKKKIKSSCVN